MSKLKQDKIPVTLDNKGNLYMDQLLDSLPKPQTPKWKLVRERDGLTKQSAEVAWLEWDETGKFKARHDYPDLGRSLMMSPFNQYFTWQTTVITGIQEQREDYICFDTENSRYELFKIDQQKQALTDMMSDDEESGLYESNKEDAPTQN